ncbi:hypothetical protein DFH08DRAFT_961794 [Mycena albidolilacea]|uniref:Uncharacterized protein n=1 Tax=Mycena albidolilacea TaxID=1033008 RepID=A0AAD7A093_9AGAR|nr:hypothetical protein DFH08DRAFT_961794 [Mycena albidolilacea]
MSRLLYHASRPWTALETADYKRARHLHSGIVRWSPCQYPLRPQPVSAPAILPCRPKSEEPSPSMFSPVSLSATAHSSPFSPFTMSPSEAEICPASPSLSSETEDSPMMSPVTESKPQLALIPTFDAKNSFLTLDLLLGDPIVRSLFNAILAGVRALPTITEDDIIPHIDHGVHLYYLRPVIAAQYRTALETLVSIIHCAANDVNPWLLRLAQNIPTYINEANLCEFGLHTGPGLSLFRGYLGVTFEALYHSREEVWEIVELLGKVIPYFVFWIANGVRISIEHGYSSCWNFGAPIGMSRTEFLHRVSRNFFYGGYSSLAVKMRDEADRNEMDFACARLVSPDATHLICTLRDSDTYLAVWPLADDDHPIQAREPMDHLTRAILKESNCTVEDVAKGLELMELEDALMVAVGN